MQKLTGLFTGLTMILLGSAVLSQGFSPLLSSSMIFLGLGVSLMFEKKVIKESSSLLERKLASIAPVLSEIALITSIVYVSGFLEVGFAYLAIVLIKTEFLNRLSEISEVSQSRLLGRLSRVLILALGVAAAEFNSFIYFYALIASGLTALYDTAVISVESSSGI